MAERIASPDRTGLAGAFAAAVLALWAGPALAGPPYITDDPQPTDTGHWEIYNYSLGTDVMGVTTGEGGFDINYGAYKDVQLTAVIPLGYQSGEGPTKLGMGDIELAAKYKFLHQDDHSWMPDVAIFPRVFVPTSGRRFGGTGRADLFVPIWAEKDFGSWQVFGGGGYQFNPGPGQRNFWQSGLVVARDVTKRLNLGVEVYHNTADSVDARDYTGVNLGLTYKLVEHWSLLAAGGPGVQNAREGGRYDFYVALKADY